MERICIIVGSGTGKTTLANNLGKVSKGDYIYAIQKMGEPNVNYAQYIIGNYSYLKPLTNPKETSIFMANVTFEPKCRNNWHIHHATKGGGQILNRRK